MASSTKKVRSFPSSPVFASRMQEKLQQNNRSLDASIDEPGLSDGISPLLAAPDARDEFEKFLDLIPPYSRTRHEQVPVLLDRKKKKDSKKKKIIYQPNLTFHPHIDPKSVQLDTHHSSDFSSTTTSASATTTSASTTATNNNHDGSEGDVFSNKNYGSNNNTTNNTNNNTTSSNNNNSTANNDHNNTFSNRNNISPKQEYSVNNKASTPEKIRGHRLYELDKEIEQRKQEKRKESEAKKFAECTFTPTVTAHPAASDREVVHRIYDWYNEKTEKHSKIRTEAQIETAELAVEECSFKPKINPLPNPRDRLLPEGSDKHIDRQQKGREQKEIVKEAEFNRYKIEHWEPKHTEPQEFSFMLREKLKHSSSSSSSSPHLPHSSPHSSPSPPPPFSHTYTSSPRTHPHPHAPARSASGGARSNTPTTSKPTRIYNTPKSHSFSAYSSSSHLPSNAPPKPFTAKYAGGLISVADVEKVRSLLSAYTNDDDDDDDNSNDERSSSGNTSYDEPNNYGANNIPEDIPPPPPAPPHTSSLSPYDVSNSNMRYSLAAQQQRHNILFQASSSRPSSAPPEMSNDDVFYGATANPAQRSTRAPNVARPFHHTAKQ